MDQRLYHYQYRRPRLSNPTYSSFNVNSSMTYFMNNPNSNNLGNNPLGKSSYQDAYTQQNYNNHNHNSSLHLNQSSYNYNNNYNKQTPRQHISQTPRQTPKQRQRAQSQLSSYGNNSLAFNQRQIYNKQNSKFNIISLKPKQIPDKIKQYPKLTLQNKDHVYYQKMQMMREQQQMRNSMRNSQVQQGQGQGDNIAGKHTFAPQEAKNPSYYQHGRYFTPRMLNHADQVSHIM